MKNKKQGGKQQPKVFRPKKAINKRNKIEIKFDPNARKDFLNGFHKRKMARKKRAQEELAAEMKIEKKRIRDEAKNMHNNFTVSHRAIPEVEELIGKEETFDFEQHSVSIKELSTASLADENFWIGENRTTYDDDENAKEETAKPEASKPKKEEPKTGKELKRAVKKMATKQVQKSKIFQKKNKLEQRKQKKKSRMEKRQQVKKGSKGKPSKQKNSGGKK